MTDRLTMIADAVARLRPMQPGFCIVECFDCGDPIAHRGPVRRRKCAKCKRLDYFANNVDRHVQDNVAAYVNGGTALGFNGDAVIMSSTQTMRDLTPSGYERIESKLHRGLSPRQHLWLPGRRGAACGAQSDAPVFRTWDRAATNCPACRAWVAAHP